MKTDGGPSGTASLGLLSRSELNSRSQAPDLELLRVNQNVRKRCICAVPLTYFREIRIWRTFETGRDFGNQAIQNLHSILEVTEAQSPQSDITQKVPGKSGLSCILSVIFKYSCPTAVTYVCEHLLNDITQEVNRSSKVLKMQIVGLLDFIQGCNRGNDYLRSFSSVVG